MRAANFVGASSNDLAIKMLRLRVYPWAATRGRFSHREFRDAFGATGPWYGSCKTAFSSLKSRRARMKTLVRLCLCVLSVLFAAATSAETRLGVVGGANFATLHLSVSEEGFDFINRTAPWGGLIVDVGVGHKLSIQVEPTYVGSRTQTLGIPASTTADCRWASHSSSRSATSDQARPATRRHATDVSRRDCRGVWSGDHVVNAV
jgi:uncharacterized protein YraI